MKLIICFGVLWLSVNSYGQEFIDPEKLLPLHLKPTILGINSQKLEITLDYILENGLTVITHDKTYKVVQFDVVYDCHSRSLIDFSVKRYRGNKVLANDEYMRKRILTGDIMDIINVVVEKDGQRYRLKELTFLVVK